MKLETNRESTKIELGEAYCFNYDKMMEACVYLSAKHYWDYGGGRKQMEVYKKLEPIMYREYLRLKYALQRFEGMTEKQIFDGVAYGYSYKDNGWDKRWRNEFRYHKTIETLFELRHMMWN